MIFKLLKFIAGKGRAFSLDFRLLNVDIKLTKLLQDKYKINIRIIS